MEHGRATVADAVFFSVVLGFASGIVFDSLTPVNAPMHICSGASSLVFFLVAACSKKLRLPCLVLGVFLAVGLFGMYRSDMAKPDAERFRESVGEKVEVEGIVVTEPAQKNGSQKFTLKVERLPGRGPLSVLVTANAYPELAYGDKVTARGTLAVPENFTTDQGAEFDYVSYLYRNDILYQLKNATAVVESRGHGNWLVRKLIPVKNAILKSFRRVLPAREADLLAGLNLGEKSNLDPEFRNDLVATGTIHMIALSGSNVTVVSNALRDFLLDALRLSQRFAAWGGTIGVVLFVTMTGLQSSAVRAGVMALISIFARGKGRTYDAFRALMLSGFLMALFDPKYLVFDASFQLSFLATLGIIFVTPLLERAFARVPKRLLWVIPLREALSVTLGAQIAVLPFILYKMGTLSIISLPANILVLPPVPLAMGMGALAGLVGAFSVRLATPFSFVTYHVLRYITGTIRFFAKVPYGSFTFHDFPLWLCLCMYLFLLWIVFRSRKAYSSKNDFMVTKNKKIGLPERPNLANKGEENNSKQTDSEELQPSDRVVPGVETRLPDGSYGPEYWETK